MPEPRGFVADEDIKAGQIVSLTGEKDEMGRPKVERASWETRAAIHGRAIRDIAKGEIVPYEPESGRLG